MRVVSFISEDFYFLSHRRELLRGLVARGCSVTLVTRLGRAKELVLQTGVPVIDLSLERENLSVLNFIGKSVGYRRILRAERPALAMAVALKPILTLALARKFGANIPALYAVTGLGSIFAGESLRMRLVRRMFEICLPILLNDSRAYFLFQNRDDQELFVGRGWADGSRCFIIPGAGVCLDQFQPKRWEERPQVRFLFAGRLLRDKGVEVLINACQQLRSEKYQFECWVAGRIDQSNPSAVPLDYIEAQHRAGIIEWLGDRNDIPALMSHADCFVLPTYYREGIPKVLLEASAAGLPIVATDMVGCRDVVTHEKNGLLVQPRSVESLVAAMKRVISNRGLLPGWGKIARDRATQEYGIERIIEQHIRIFERIAADTGVEVSFGSKNSEIEPGACGA